ncbi:MAG: hypothetical protein ACPG32_10745 [Akkermansiaceae bacterium]
MSDTKMPVSYYIKQGVIIALALGLALFGVKTCNRHQDGKAAVAELTPYASEASAFEQFYADNAKADLYKAMYQMHRGTELGMTAPEMLDEINGIEDGGWFSTTDKPTLTDKQRLIKESLLSNFDNCRKLGIFDEQENIDALAEGEPPEIMTGPMAGQKAVVLTVIPEKALPGVDKILPNLLIAPPGKPDTAEKIYTDFERERAVNLVVDLIRIRLLDQAALQKVSDYFKKNQSAPKPTEPEKNP